MKIKTSVLCLGICYIVLYSGVFLGNSLHFFPNSEYTWPNLKMTRDEFSNPQTPYQFRLSKAMHAVLESYLQQYDETLGLALQSSSSSTEDIQAHNRVQIRLALLCFIFHQENAQYQTIGNQLLRSLYTEFRETSPAAGYRTFGNLYWDLTDGQVDDLNAAPFNSIVLGYISYYYQDLLEPDVLQFWKEALSEVVSACVLRQHDPNYTNIQILRNAGILMLGHILNDRSTIELGMQIFYDWYEYTVTIGLTEYGTINYLEVALKGLMALWEFSPTQKFSDDVMEMLEFIWTYYIGQENNGNLGAAHYRDYPNHYLYGMDLREAIHTYIAPIYPDVGLDSAWLPLFNWKPPQKLIDLALAKAYPNHMDPYNISCHCSDTFITSYYTENFSLGAQSGVNHKKQASSQAIPVMCTYNTSKYGEPASQNGNIRNSLFFRDNEGFRNLRTTSVQENNKLAVMFQFNPKGLDKDEEIGVIGCLGNGSAMSNLIVQNSSGIIFTDSLTTESLLSVSGNLTISYELGNLYFGLHLWAYQAANQTNPGVIQMIRLGKSSSQLEKWTALEGVPSDEIVVFIPGINTLSGAFIIVSQQTDWDNISEFQDQLVHSLAYIDQSISDRRIMRVIFGSSSFNALTFEASCSYPNGEDVFRSLNGIELIDMNIYTSPWLVIVQQDHYTTFDNWNWAENTPYIIITLLILLQWVGLVSINQKQKAWVPSWIPFVFRPKPSPGSPQMSKKVCLWLDVAFIGTMIFTIVATLLELFTWTSVLITTNIQILFGLKLLQPFASKLSDVFDRSVRFFRWIWGGILAIASNLVLFFIGQLVFPSYFWLLPILYAVVQIIFGMTLILAEEQNFPNLLPSEKPPCFAFIKRNVLGLFWMGFGFALLFDVQNCEILLVGLTLVLIGKIIYRYYQQNHSF